jgi:1,4-dihydroxy-2-naphthoate octaprenyltransferase
MKNLFRVARLQFLIAGLALFVLGGLWAVLLGASFSLLRLLLGYLVILPAQLSVHFSNDYFDVGSDRPGQPTLISGGGGVLLEHPELREPVKWIALGLILSSLGVGFVFLRMYAYPLWIFGFVVLGNLLGWCYSAPPVRLSRRGLGEVSYTFIAGCLVPGMGYLVLRGTLDAGGLFFLPPLILYGLASILSVEIPDVEDDTLSHKATWLARMGRASGFTAIGWLLVAATGYFFLSPMIFPRQARMDPRVLGVLSFLPLGVGLWGMLRRPLERKVATGIATGIVIMLAAFSIIRGRLSDLPGNPLDPGMGRSSRKIVASMGDSFYTYG